VRTSGTSRWQLAIEFPARTNEAAMSLAGPLPRCRPPPGTAAYRESTCQPQGPFVNPDSAHHGPRREAGAELRFQTNPDAADKFRRLPYQNLPGEIHIDLAADTLYDFDKNEVRSSAADYIQQTANLIFEEAKGPVRIECRSDRLPTQSAKSSPPDAPIPSRNG
jgi:hypothetical protein